MYLQFFSGSCAPRPPCTFTVTHLSNPWPLCTFNFFLGAAPPDPPISQRGRELVCFIEGAHFLWTPHCPHHFFHWTASLYRSGIKNIVISALSHIYAFSTPKPRTTPIGTKEKAVKYKFPNTIQNEISRRKKQIPKILETEKINLHENFSNSFSSCFSFNLSISLENLHFKFHENFSISFSSCFSFNL